MNTRATLGGTQLNLQSLQTTDWNLDMSSIGTTCKFLTRNLITINVLFLRWSILRNKNRI